MSITTRKAAMRNEILPKLASNIAHYFLKKKEPTLNELSKKVYQLDKKILERVLELYFCR